MLSSVMVLAKTATSTSTGGGQVVAMVTSCCLCSILMREALVPVRLMMAIRSCRIL